MLGLQYFSFNDLWSPLILALFLLIAAAYLVLVGPFIERIKGQNQQQLRKKSCFSRGLPCCIWLKRVHSICWVM